MATMLTKTMEGKDSYLIDAIEVAMRFKTEVVAIGETRHSETVVLVLDQNRKSAG